MQPVIRRDEHGFTLIELMVVVLIIAILIAIAIPTFLGARERAQDRAAQSSLRNGLTTAKEIFTDNEDYTEADALTLGGAEPSLDFRDGGNSTGPKDVSVAAPSQTEFVAAVLSKSGECFYVRDDASGAGTQYDRSDGPGCDAASPPGSWAGDW